MHNVANLLVIGQDPTFKILDSASFSKYLAVSSDKFLFVYSIRLEPELLLDLKSEITLSAPRLTSFRDGLFLLSKRNLFWMGEELELTLEWKNVYSFCVISDYTILLCTRDKLSLVNRPNHFYYFVDSL